MCLLSVDNDSQAVLAGLVTRRRKSVGLRAVWDPPGDFTCHFGVNCGGGVVWMRVAFESAKLAQAKICCVCSCWFDS